ncbi:uncharacterized protein PITG_16369 [Phytophthora infestans T30-4]|uniref:K Homology domain-containing protein n=1 Tax=Phytophthora infestans (strain T30-4) TaxID=403677 RepID=D0NU47_PHYIT|nr:uncharacterized protein PITG_16369 [Phytophthora infestans T30-4]EEY65171.1 conserved hypothetical protein [Phytophthora infestans T30-4]KAI9989209.1 hypothetical protein PInf_019354 [Phytophthora infestans]|eukprot:XP_002897428.1 conserved hypothetical protein [Phytophthora infestans T30-4]
MRAKRLIEENFSRQEITDQLEAENDDVQENGMVVDHKGTKCIRTIDLSDVTYFKVPREQLPMLHGEGGETMGKFQEYTGTYIVLPSPAASAAFSMSNVLTLSIYELWATWTLFLSKCSNNTLTNTNSSTWPAKFIK